MAERLVQKVQTPALPIPRPGPLKHYLDDLNNILRLFFNLLANAVNNVFGELGGRFIDVPNALYFSTVDQPIAVVNTGQVVTFNQTYLESGFSINGGSNSQITATYGGVYNFQFTTQIVSGSASSKTIYLWISRSGTDLGYTAKDVVLQGSSDVNEATWNFNLDLAAGEYVEMKWSSDDIDASLNSEAATSPHPGVASAVVTINFISALPETRPTPP
ncbi:MAG: hypothetical protein P1U85_22835 [Verrucomicrobiales bacterium]|nr:hypothetical protein [Verrucomicrobiales bacterium]